MRSKTMDGKRTCFVMMALLFAGHAFGYNVVVTNDDKLGVVYDVAMKQNEKVTIEGEDVNLAVDQLTDSRCPAPATCIWQGNVVAQVAVDHKGVSVGKFNLAYMDGLPVAASAFLANGYSIALQSVAASREEDGQYPIVLRLVKKAGSCDEILTKMCTMEFLPVTCTLGGLSAQSGNSCQSTLQLEYKACKRNQFFNEEMSRCQPSGDGFSLVP